MKERITEAGFVAGGPPLPGAPHPSDAVWSAFDILRGRGAAGRAAIYDVGGERVAVVPIWAVPDYRLLPWVPVSEVAITLARNGAS